VAGGGGVKPPSPSSATSKRAVGVTSAEAGAPELRTNYSDRRVTIALFCEEVKAQVKASADNTENLALCRTAASSLQAQRTFIPTKWGLYLYPNSRTFPIESLALDS
jgi:hypothetical protein